MEFGCKISFVEIGRQLGCWDVEFHSTGHLPGPTAKGGTVRVPSCGISADLESSLPKGMPPLAMRRRATHWVST